MLSFFFSLHWWTSGTWINYSFQGQWAMIMDCWICSTVPRGSHVMWMFTLGSNWPGSSPLSRAFCLIELWLSKGEVQSGVWWMNRAFEQRLTCGAAMRRIILILNGWTSVPKEMGWRRRISETCRIFRSATFTIKFCNFVMNSGASLCTTQKSKGVSNSVIVECKFHHETWAGAFC